MQRQAMLGVVGLLVCCCAIAAEGAKHVPHGALQSFTVVEACA